MGLLIALFLLLSPSLADGESMETDETRELESPNSPRFLQRRATTVLYDDFSSGSINPNRWKLDCTAVGNSAEQFQMWSPAHENSYVKNGVLYIRPTYTTSHFGNNYLNNGQLDVRHEWGYCTGARANCVAHGWHQGDSGNQVKAIMSARLNSAASIRFGKVEVVAELSIGDWIRSAIWMMPVTNAYGSWPRSGEIDLLEAVGNRHYTLRDQPNVTRGPAVAHSNIHYGASRDELHRHHGDDYTLPHSTFGDGFHKYWLDWTENHIKVGVDDHTILALDTPPHGWWQEGHFPSTESNLWSSGSSAAPFDTPFYLILDVAVGGGQFSEYFDNQPYAKPWLNHDPDAMQKFWAARRLWEPTWHGEGTAMKIKSVKMQQY